MDYFPFCLLDRTLSGKVKMVKSPPASGLCTQNEQPVRFSGSRSENSIGFEFL